MSEITYDDKVDLQVATNIANINKVTASDMNEIKSVVNQNATATETELTRLETDKLDIADVLNQASTDTDKPYSADYLNNKLVSVGTTAPENGERVWFKKSKNKLKLDNVSGTKNGVTYNWEGNKLTLNGTTTASTDIYNFGFWNATTQDANRFLTAGTYTLSIQGASNVGKFSITLYYGTTQVISLFRDNTSVTKTFDSGTYYSNCYISILSNQTFNNDVFYIQIEERK